MKEGCEKMPQEEIGDKKEKQEKKEAKEKMPEFVERLKEAGKPRNWLKEKFDHWREQL